MFLNWLSGALVGVGGSDFIGRRRAKMSRARHKKLDVTAVMMRDAQMSTSAMMGPGLILGLSGQDKSGPSKGGFLNNRLCS